MSLARFNLFAESYMYLLFRAPSGFYRNLELAGVAFFWLWFGKGVLGSIPDFGTRIGFLLLCFVVTSPLHVQVSLDSLSTFKKDCYQLNSLSLMSDRAFSLRSVNG